MTQRTGEWSNYGMEIGCAIYMLLRAMLESLIVSACVVVVYGTVLIAHKNYITCFDSTIILLL